MRRWVLLCAVATYVVFASARVFAIEHAGGWPLRSAAPIVLEYGATYAGPDGTSRTHRGVDLAAGEGDELLAICAGTVAFAGRVPGTDGGSTLAISIDSDDGLRYTIMPVANVECVAGDRIAAGTIVGALAPVGDASVAESHVHVSVRRGDAYLDPSPLLCPPGAMNEAGTPDPSVTTAGCPVVAPATADALSSAAHGANPESVQAPLEGHRGQPVSTADPLSESSGQPAAIPHASRVAGMESRLSPPAGSALARPSESKGHERAAGARLSLVRSGALLWVTIATGCVALLSLWPLWRHAAFAPPLRPGLVKLRQR